MMMNANDLVEKKRIAKLFETMEKKMIADSITAVHES
jgi:hypothetical protein